MRAAALSDEDLRELCREVVGPDARQPLGAYILRPDEPGAALARHVEGRVFYEAFGNTPDLLLAQYGRYERDSLFLCVLDHRRLLPAGAMRLIHPSERGFKSFHDVEPVWGEPAEAMVRRTCLSLDPERTWDIATIAIAEDYRGGALHGMVGMGLYQTLTLAAFHCGIRWFIAILDMPVFRLLRWKLRMIFAGFEGVRPMPYLGSVASLPAWCDVTDAERRLATEDPALHEVLCRGRGIDAALRTVDLRAADPYVVGAPLRAIEPGLSA
jgi:hypothetical protein